MAKDLGCQLIDLIGDNKLRSRIQPSKYVSERIGLPTLMDIMGELAKPGRDPRSQFEIVQFKEDVQTMEDLKIGMKLTGIVTNVTNFGAFVDVGVHQDGLVHISEISEKFISNPADVLKVGQKVQVTVVDVDLKRKRISLTMRSKPKENQIPEKQARNKPLESNKIVLQKDLSASNKRKPLYDF
jgi:uncharacterized protein